jgi:hypothetical protein
MTLLHQCSTWSITDSSNIFLIRNAKNVNCFGISLVLLFKIHELNRCLSYITTLLIGNELCRQILRSCEVQNWNLQSTNFSNLFIRMKIYSKFYTMYFKNNDLLYLKLSTNTKSVLIFSNFHWLQLGILLISSNFVLNNFRIRKILVAKLLTFKRSVTTLNDCILRQLELSTQQITMVWDYTYWSI